MVSDKKAAPNLIIDNIYFDYNKYTAGSSSQARSYRFTYSFSYKIIDKKGKALIPWKKLSAKRTVILNSHQLMSSNDEAHIVKQEMQRELIRNLLERLGSEQSQELLAVKTDTPKAK